MDTMTTHTQIVSARPHEVYRLVADVTLWFRQEHSHPPIASMRGAWSFRPPSGGRTEVVLDHTFAVTDSDLARLTELGHPVQELIDTFSDTMVLDGS